MTVYDDRHDWPSYAIEARTTLSAMLSDRSLRNPRAPL